MKMISTGPSQENRRSRSVQGVDLPELELKSTYDRIASLWSERVNKRYPGFPVEPWSHVLTVEKLRWKNRPTNPKLLLLAESHVRSPQNTMNKRSLCVAKHGVKFVYNTARKGKGRIWNCLEQIALKMNPELRNISKEGNQAYRNAIFAELSERGVWLADISIMALSGFQTLRHGSDNDRLSGNALEVVENCRARGEGWSSRIRLRKFEGLRDLERHLLLLSWEGYVKHCASAFVEEGGVTYACYPRIGRFLKEQGFPVDSACYVSGSGRHFSEVVRLLKNE